MPLHRIYAPADLFSAQDKKELAASITSHYTSIGLPAFYVIVLFVPIDADTDFFIGGESHAERHKRTGRPFVRVVSQHLAATMVGDRRKAGTDALCKMFDKWIADRGYEWELHIEEPARDLWREDGLIPPPHPSEEEDKWVEADAAVPYY